MSSLELLSTSDVATRLGITRQAVAARVVAGTLTPAFKLDSINGAYLFEPAVIDEAKARYQR